MSRSGYTDDCDDYLAIGRWRQAVNRALKGKRGQAFLRELLAALDSMSDKQLSAGSFQTAEGEFCTLGVIGNAKGIQMDDLLDTESYEPDEDGYCDTQLVGNRFGIAMSMAAEIMWINDEHTPNFEWEYFEICGPVRPGWPDYGSHRRQRWVEIPDHKERRWKNMRNWVEKNIKPEIDAMSEVKS
jgi:hypothetical protein